MTDKIKFCPQCNSCLFDDMMTCCVCGYQFAHQDRDLVPLCAYEEIDKWDELPKSESSDGEISEEVPTKAIQRGKTVSLKLDCGDCLVDISIHPK